MQHEVAVLGYDDMELCDLNASVYLSFCFLSFFLWGLLGEGGLGGMEGGREGGREREREERDEQSQSESAAHVFVFIVTIIIIIIICTWHVFLLCSESLFDVLAFVLECFDSTGQVVFTSPSPPQSPPPHHVPTDYPTDMIEAYGHFREQCHV